MLTVHVLQAEDLRANESESNLHKLFINIDRWHLRTLCNPCYWELKDRNQASSLESSKTCLGWKVHLWYTNRKWRSTSISSE